MPPRILIVDDHVEMAEVLRDHLTDAGYTVAVADGGARAVAVLQREPPAVVVTDLRMAEVDGFDVLDAARAVDPDIAVIVMTAFGSIDTAIEAIKRGAYHYVTKPLRLDELALHVERAVEQRGLRSENRSLRRLAGLDGAGGGVLGVSAAMRALAALCQRVAQSSAPVLIRGESGTGKELVARAIHAGGPRKDAPLVPVNCTALPDTLLESELFGHVRGAFSGATTDRRGLLVEADGGTLLLDEIGDMDLALQAKLLRVLQDGVVRPVGADAGRKVDVRVIAATHKDLEAAVREGRFREDLYYRLDVVPLRIPPLRERPEDIPPLVSHFLERARARNPHSPVEALSPTLVSHLGGLPWPGNVRELENLVERLVVVCTTPVVDLPDALAIAPRLAQADNPLAQAQRELLPLRELETRYIAWVVDQCEGNKTRAAELLGVDVSTIHRRLRPSQ